jgi:hypothetical protein
MPVIALAVLLPATAVFAVLFHFPTCVHRILRVCALHRRDKVACQALREMKYNPYYKESR